MMFPYRMRTNSNSMSEEKSQTAADGEEEQELRALVAEYEKKIDDVETIEQLAIRLRDIAAELRQVQRPLKTSQSDGS